MSAAFTAILSHCYYKYKINLDVCLWCFLNEITEHYSLKDSKIKLVIPKKE